MSLAFVFPGQGSQFVGMGKHFFDNFPEARAVFEAADDALNENLSKLCFEGPEESLRLTANTQPAILVVSLAAHAVWTARAPGAAIMAGHSLGEYTALVAAGALKLPDAVRAVRARGRFMQEAVPEGVGAMAAVLGLAAQSVEAVCEAVAEGQVLSPANYNSPDQTVIAGHATAVARANPKLIEAGAKKVVPLPVSAPFHCRLMDPVKARLAQFLSQIALTQLSVPVISNAEAEPNLSVARVVPLLIEQVSRPVRWTETVQQMEKEGVRTVLELGPGRVLGGLVRRISKNIRTLNVEDARSLEQALAA
jgi:[acyl-carrier-protein] S-malonyltransferase